MDELHGNHSVSAAEHREHQQALFAKRIIDVGTDQQLRVEYDGDQNPIYVGLGARGLAASATGWLVSKYTFDVNNNPTLRQTATGAWDDRATLTYA